MSRSSRHRITKNDLVARFEYRGESLPQNWRPNKTTLQYIYIFIYIFFFTLNDRIIYFRQHSIIIRPIVDLITMLFLNILSLLRMCNVHSLTPNSHILLYIWRKLKKSLPDSLIKNTVRHFVPLTCIRCLLLNLLNLMIKWKKITYCSFN